MNFNRMLLAGCLTTVLILAGNLAALAHGGEDHSADQPTQVSTSDTSVVRTARAHGVEILLKHDRLIPDLPTSVRLFTTAEATNQPATHIALRLSVEGGSSPVDVEATPTQIVGMYEARIPALPEGSYTMSVRATAGAESFVVTFGHVVVEARDHSPAGSVGASITAAPPLAWIALGGGIVLGVAWATAFALARLRRAERVQS